MLHALLLVSVVFGTAAFAMLLANLALLPRLSRERPGRIDWPRVSIVTPARNEERSLEAAILSHLRQDYPSFEVLVVNDRSTDRTEEILARLARRDSRLRVIDGRDPPPGWLGKPHALHLGSREATGDLLLFVDADVRYEPQTLREAVWFLERRRADFLALLPWLEVEGFWEKMLMPYLVEPAFFGPAFLANWGRPRWLAVGGGAGNLIRRKAYERLGGHERIRASVIDDVRLALEAKRVGCWTLFVRAEDRVRVRMYRGLREVWDGFTKNVAYAFDGFFGAWLALFLVLSLLLALLPPGALLASLLGARLSSQDLRLAASGFGILAIARLILATALRGPFWPGFFYPITSLVWAGIIGRSFYHRIIRRRLTWRGREFDARAARF